LSFRLFGVQRKKKKKKTINHTGTKMTTWTHPRNITIKIPSTHKTEPELRAGFKIEPAQSEEFGKLLEAYLKFCYEAKAMIRVESEIVDIESKQPHAITFVINGERAATINELQRVGNALLQHSTRIQ
jgi:hypothetical protein